MGVDDSVAKAVRTICTRNAAKSEKFRFNTGEKAFSQQFAKLYEIRLKSMTKNLTKCVESVWGG